MRRRWSFVVAINPTYGPPYAIATPKLWASPTTICAPQDDGVASAPSDIASLTTAIGTVSLALTASRAADESESTLPKKFGDCNATQAYSFEATAAASFAISVAPSAVIGSSSTSTSSPSQ